VTVTAGWSWRDATRPPASPLVQSGAASRPQVDPLPPSSLALPRGLKLDLAGIPAGNFFLFGTRRVNISNSFYIGKYEITRGQWRVVMQGDPSAFPTLADTCPVESVSWEQCEEFCRRATQLTGRRVRLPRETEWEYACRAGTTSDFFFGNNPADLPRYAWQSVEAEGNIPWSSQLVRPPDWQFKNADLPQPVGTRLPNPWGLHDMYGNVYEWCVNDINPARPAGESGSASAQRPRSAASLRGGSWGSHYMNELRSRHREAFAATTGRRDAGLRVVVEIDAATR
jgi:formylglycine-generating enzyme required for sulfatase activity